MTIPSHVLSHIWDKLESPLPNVGYPQDLWGWYYKNYFSAEESKIIAIYLNPPEEYWNAMANLFLLILLSEGHSI